MAAGVTDKLWEIGSIVKVLEDWETMAPVHAGQLTDQSDLPS
jgi:hypothetical protein